MLASPLSFASMNTQLQDVAIAAVQGDTAVKRSTAQNSWIIGIDSADLTTTNFDQATSTLNINFADVAGFANIRGAVVGISTVQLFVLRPGPVAAAPSPNTGYAVQVQMLSTATRNRYTIRPGSNSFIQSQNLIRCSPVLVQNNGGGALADVYEWKLAGPLPQSYIGQSLASIQLQIQLESAQAAFGATLSRVYLTMRVEQVD